MSEQITLPDSMSPAEVVGAVAGYFRSKFPSKSLTELAQAARDRKESDKNRGARIEQTAKDLAVVTRSTVITPAVGILKGVTKGILGMRTQIEKAVGELDATPTPTVEAKPKAEPTIVSDDNKGEGTQVHAQQ